MNALIFISRFPMPVASYQCNSACTIFRLEPIDDCVVKTDRYAGFALRGRNDSPAFSFRKIVVLSHLLSRMDGPQNGWPRHLSTSFPPPRSSNTPQTFPA